MEENKNKNLGLKEGEYDPASIYGWNLTPLNYDLIMNPPAPEIKRVRLTYRAGTRCKTRGLSPVMRTKYPKIKGGSIGVVDHTDNESLSVYVDFGNEYGIIKLHVVFDRLEPVD